MVPTKIRNSDYKLVKKYFCEKQSDLNWGGGSQAPLYLGNKFFTYNQHVSDLYIVIINF